ncbi:MAG: ATP-binding protein [Deltaproteobacteria bacterium]|nr:ATP-binding protein [Deltaproteobacteria bacterium]
MQFARYLDIKGDSSKRSLFLFGPRLTGKTALLKKTFPESPFYNLLLADVFLKLSQHPQLIREELTAMGSGCREPVIIDEIQKLPILLDEVHNLIEDKGLRFILTGSSPRKLKRGGANLLGGRAWTRHLFPLVTKEIPNFDLNRILNFGALPVIYNSDDPEEDLAAYVGNYLTEEIHAEGVVRHIENFSRFLQTAALCNTELLNFEGIGNDAQVPPRTIREYFFILQDTLIGRLLVPFNKTKKRKAISTSKFYFFDVGVSNFLAGRNNIQPKSELYGKVFEHFIFTELCACLDYTKNRSPLTFWRTQQQDEVDFVIDDKVAIEVKATSLVTERHLKGLKKLGEEVTLKHKIVVSLDSHPRLIGDIQVLPVTVFLERLWGKDFI